MNETMEVLKFRPRVKELLWGSESWQVSGVKGDVSVVAGGGLKGNNLQELIEVYMGELVGEGVFAKYGEEFPVLVKRIDARQTLSVQVHPGDELARERHGAYGKTEMWYVVDADPGAALYVGWNREVSEREYLDAVAGGTVAELLRKFEVKAGDAFFIPAGTVHAIGAGVRIAEIQETSDVTYRIYDWDRVDDKGQPRQLHTELAVGAIDFGVPQDYVVTREPVKNVAVLLKECPWFTVNLLELDGALTRPVGDSFVIYMCVGGSATVGGERVAAGESVLVPAEMDDVRLDGQAKLLEISM
jgi:mannose-6-phosphate isomerase